MARPIGGRLSEVFRATYEAAGLTQAQLADELQRRGFGAVEQTHVSRWARGMAKVPLEILPAVEDACGVPLGTILRDAGYVAEPEEVGVLGAIAIDPHLDRQGRISVSETYEFQVRRSVERSRSTTSAS